MIDCDDRMTARLAELGGSVESVDEQGRQVVYTPAGVVFTKIANQWRESYSVPQGQERMVEEHDLLRLQMARRYWETLIKDKTRCFNIAKAIMTGTYRGGQVRMPGHPDPGPPVQGWSMAWGWPPTKETLEAMQADAQPAYEALFQLDALIAPLLEAQQEREQKARDSEARYHAARQAEQSAIMSMALHRR